MINYKPNNNISLVFDRVFEDSSSDHLILQAVEVKGNQEKIKIPSKIKVSGKSLSVELVASRAFEKICCEEIVLPESVYELSDYAFFNVDARRIVIPSSVCKIPSNCFAKSTVERIDFTDLNEIKEVGDGAFYNVSGLKKITWPTNCAVIPQFCFQNSSIETIKGIEDVEFIGAGAFKFTRTLKSFNWPKRCKQIPEDCFCESGIRSIDGIEGVEVIGPYAFQSTPNLLKFNWPSACSSIPTGCFLCGHIRNISGTENVLSIGNRAFKASSLKTISLPNVKEIGNAAFVDTPFKEKIVLGGDKSDTLKLSASTFPSQMEVDVTNYQNVEVYADMVIPIPYIKGAFDTDISIIKAPV